MQQLSRRDRLGERSRVEFDLRDVDMAVVFAPERPVEAMGENWLWWTKAPAPATISAVIEILEATPQSVETIVIGGLERYPQTLHWWSRRIAHLARSTRRCRIVVDTRGLTGRQRRRLISRTRRQMAMSQPADPVTRAWSAFTTWCKRRWR